MVSANEENPDFGDFYSSYVTLEASVCIKTEAKGRIATNELESTPTNKQDQKHHPFPKSMKGKKKLK